MEEPLKKAAELTAVVGYQVSTVKKLQADLLCK